MARWFGVEKSNLWQTVPAGFCAQRDFDWLELRVPSKEPPERNGKRVERQWKRSILESEVSVLPTWFTWLPPHFNYKLPKVTKCGSPENGKKLPCFRLNDLVLVSDTECYRGKMCLHEPKYLTEEKSIVSFYSGVGDVKNWYLFAANLENVGEARHGQNDQILLWKNVV